MLVKTTLKYFSPGDNFRGEIKNVHVGFPIEYIHLSTGYILILSGVQSYFIHGIEMLLAWAIFGCMYISMSDIGECSKCGNELCSFKHKNRRLIAYVGFLLSLILLIHYLFSLI